MGAKLPKLPQLLERKIYKTGQTRGADDDEIFQNRVSRSSTVLIPYPVWRKYFTVSKANKQFEKGYIVLTSPHDYFDTLRGGSRLLEQGLRLGDNCLVFYETRSQWNTHEPSTLRWVPATSRTKPLGGQYVARIPATTATEGGAKIIHGFETTANKGAGIRVYEYASDEMIVDCRNQLEALFWLSGGSEAAACQNGMERDGVIKRKKEILRRCEQAGLLDLSKLKKARILNKRGQTICPLCLEELLPEGFVTRMEQAAGREVVDLTITQINLFHIRELRMGGFNHCPYNLGWGHHHCNVVVKDAGIQQTLKWMDTVLRRNIRDGHFPANN